MVLASLVLLGCAQSALADARGHLDRHRDLQRASMLLPSDQRHDLKYNPTAGTLPAFPNETAGSFFSGVFTDHVVLQREPAKAAVYGVIFGAEAGTAVTVTVTTSEGAKLYDAPGTVMHTEVKAPGGAYAKWKAFLKPAPAGGNFTVSVSCTSCANTTASKLVDVVSTYYAHAAAHIT